MGKRNPFSTKSQSSNRLLLLTTLHGQIIHITGNPRILSTTSRKLYLKNFFTSVLTNESLLQLYQELESSQVMPSWINSRRFTFMRRGNRGAGLVRVGCFRMFVKFEDMGEIGGKVGVRFWGNQGEFLQRRNMEHVKEVIMIYIQPEPQAHLQSTPKTAPDSNQPHQPNPQPPESPQKFRTPKKPSNPSNPNPQNSTSFAPKKQQSSNNHQNLSP